MIGHIFMEPVIPNRIICSNHSNTISEFKLRATEHHTLPLPMDCYLDVVGGLVPLRCEEGRPR
jgi:hypothetical protein